MTGMTPIEQDLLKRAQAYVAASNAHDIAAIESMIAADCVYVSSGVGSHDGADAIIAMMRGFFDAVPDVSWQASRYRPIAGSGVEFDFVISMNGKSSTGVERLFFDDRGMIVRVEVAR